MGVAYNTSIVKNGLRVLFDNSNIKSYSGSGGTWTDLVRKTSYTDPVSAGVGNETWMGSASTGITISVVVSKIATFVGYAEHPVNKWVNTTDASFVLYHFGDTAGGLIDRFAWYANRGGVWGNISDPFLAVNGNTYMITLQYNDLTGGQLWINGAKSGTRQGSGSRANSTEPLKLLGPTGSTSSKLLNCYMWNRELTDIEIQQNFNALRGRYGI